MELGGKRMGWGMSGHWLRRAAFAVGGLLSIVMLLTLFSPPASTLDHFDQHAMIIGLADGAVDDDAEKLDGLDLPDAIIERVNYLPVLSHQAQELATWRERPRLETIGHGRHARGPPATTA